MPSENQQFLARPINSVKKLSGGLTLSSSYYTDIKPFLFGTNSPEIITRDDLPNTSAGIHNKVTSSGMIAGSKVIIDLDGRGKTELQIADITNQNFIIDLGKEKNGVNDSNYLFPSDLVSILVKLSKKFEEKKYKKSNEPALKRFANSGSNLDLIKKWGKPQTIKSNQKDVEDKKDYFLERNLFEGESEVKDLLDTVVTAALEYEESKRVMDHDGFISESDLKKELTKILIPDILLEFKEYKEKIKGETEDKFLEADKKIREEIEKIIKDDFNFFDKLLTVKNLKSFGEQELYYLEQRTFKLTKNKPDDTTILETAEYLDFHKSVVSLFLERNEKELASKFIAPLFEEKSKDDVATSDEETEESDSGDAQEEDLTSENFTISKSQFRQRAKKDLANIVLSNFLDQITDPRFNRFRDTFFTNDLTREYSINLLGLIDSDTSSYVSRSIFFPTSLEDELKKESLINKGGIFNNAIFESNWYSSFLNKTSLNNFLTRQGEDYFKNLFNSKIAPALDILEKEQSGEDVTSTEETAKKTSDAIVPTTSSEPSKDAAPSSVKDVLEKTTLTSDQKRKIQYEAGWMYNRAVYEMFTAHGIKIEDIDTRLLENLRSDIYGYASGIDQDKLLSMLGSASKRQEALLRFYPKFANKNQGEIQDFYDNLGRKPSFKELTTEQKTQFLEFNKSFLGEKSVVSADKLIQNSISEAIGIDVKNFVKEDTNIQNTLDSMILQYGIDQEYFVQDENGKVSLIKGGHHDHDVLAVIENMSDGKFALVFGLPEGISSKKITALKKSLTSYAAYRASELSFHIQDTSLSKGLMSMSSRDIEELKKTGSETSIKHLKFTDNTRKAISDANNEDGKNGAETIASGLDGKTIDEDLENGINSRRREKINKLTRRYKTYMPLWANLSSKERQIIYNKFGIPYDKSNKDVVLDFIPEFILFDISTLDTFENINSNEFDAEEQRLYAEFIKTNKKLGVNTGNQLENEQKFARFAQDDFLYLFEDEQLLLLADYVNSGEALEDRPTSEFFDGYSTRELIALEQHIQDTGYSISKNNRHFSRSNGIMERVRNSEWGKKRGFGKKSPNNRISKTLKNSASKITKKLTSAIDALPPSWATTFLKIAKRIGFKRTAMIVVGTLGALFGLLMSFLPGWFKAMFGLGGSGLGETAGASTVAQTGTAGLKNAKMVNSGYIELANSSTNTAIQAATAAKIATASGVFFGLPIALLAPGIAMFVGLIVTMHTIFTIQSAFLVPTPPGLDGSFRGRGIPILGETACFEFSQAGKTNTVEIENEETGESESITMVSVDWDEKSMETVKESFVKVASNEKYIGLLCDNGPIMLYKFEDYYGGGQALSSSEIALYKVSFLNVRIMEYTLIHETGHIIDSRNSRLRTEYMSIKTGPGCYTYPIEERCHPDGLPGFKPPEPPFMESEAFAEGIAVYVLGNDFVGRNSKYKTNWPFKSKHLKEYKWFGENIFGGEEFP